MSRASRLISQAVALVVAAALGGMAVGRAQSPQPANTPDVLGALLIEVRGLRVAMEQMASTGPRVQLTLGRLQLQEQRITTLTRRLEDVRTSLIQTQRGLDVTAMRMRDLEQRARESTDAEVRSETEHEIKSLKSEIGRLQADAVRLTNEETALNQEIASEQGRWTEFNQRLEEIERSLTRR
jgi:hypothetical protein